MIKFLITLMIIASTLVFNLKAQEKLEVLDVEIKKGVPSEIKFLTHSLLETIHRNFSHSPTQIQAHDNEVKSLLISIDHSFQSLSAKEITLIVKSEIYKMILGEFQNGQENNFSPSQATLKELDSKLLAQSHLGIPYHHFSRWLIMAISQDMKEIIQNPNYLLLQSFQVKDKGKSDLLRLKRKMDLLSPWAMKITQSSQAEFNDFLFDLMLRTLKKVEVILKTQVVITHLQVPSISKDKLNYFAFKNATLKAIPQQKVVTTPIEEKIQDSDEEENTSSQTTNTWKPQDLPKNYPTPDPNYQPPQSLPAPTNDW